MSTAGLLVIGNEILSGKVVDTNSPFLARELREVGVDLERIVTIPDVVEVIADEVRSMHRAYDHVFTSGGIGPTHDDVTMEGVAAAFDLTLELDEQLCERIEKAVGRRMNESMKKMALLPAGAVVQGTEDLWFPLIRVENVHVLPGIPELFESKFRSIRHHFGGVPIHLRRIYVTLYESDIAESLNSLLLEFAELMLGSYPRMGNPDYHVMLTLESRDSEYLQRAFDSLLSRLPEDAVFQVD